MSLKKQHETIGVFVTILVPEAGQQLALSFPPGKTSMDVEVTIGGHRSKAKLHLGEAADMHDPSRDLAVMLMPEGQPAPAEKPAAPVKVELEKPIETQLPVETPKSEQVPLKPETSKKKS